EAPSPASLRDAGILPVPSADAWVTRARGPWGYRSPRRSHPLLRGPEAYSIPAEGSIGRGRWAVHGRGRRDPPFPRPDAARGGFPGDGQVLSVRPGPTGPWGTAVRRVPDFDLAAVDPGREVHDADGRA